MNARRGGKAKSVDAVSVGGKQLNKRKKYFFGEIFQKIFFFGKRNRAPSQMGHKVKRAEHKDGAPVAKRPHTENEKAVQAPEKRPLSVYHSLHLLSRLMKQRDEMEQECTRAHLEVEKKFRRMSEELSRKVSSVINGSVVPKADDLADFKQPAAELVVESTETKYGIPQFWQKAIANCTILSELFGVERDAKAIESLTDVYAVSFNETETEKDGKKICTGGFKICFEFAPNEFFTNAVLTKQVICECNLDLSNVKPVKVIGTKIDWKEGKKLTSDGNSEDEERGFFHFIESEATAETQPSLFEEDVLIADVIKNQFIPTALEHYLDHKCECKIEGQDDDMNWADLANAGGMDEDDDDEDEDDDDDDDDEEEEKEDAKKEKGDKFKYPENPECKQQ